MFTEENTALTTAGSISREILQATEKQPPPEDGLAVLWDFVDGQYLPQLPLRWIAAWNQNPRKVFEDTALDELTQSIRQDGVQQPIVVRPCDPGHWKIEHTFQTGVNAAFARPGFLLLDTRRIDPASGVYDGEFVIYETREEAKEAVPRFEIIMGERRFRASLKAGRTTIPAIVRMGLDDEKALELALVENLQRRDLNAIEEALGFQRLMDMGHRQAEIGEKLKRSQGEIANKLRLLKLPEVVRNLVSAGELSATHARALLRFEGFPEVMAKIAALAVKKGATAKELETGVPFHSDLVDAKLAKYLQQYEMAFDLKVCQECPLNAYRKNETHYNPLCLRPDHYAELQEQAKVERERRLQEARAELERRKQETVTPAVAPASEAPVADPTQRPETACLLRPAPVAPVLKLADLRYDEYSTLYSEVPAACTNACPCRVTAEDRNGRACEICMDPKRLQSLKAAQTRVEQKERKKQLEGIVEEIKAAMPTEIEPRILAMLVWPNVASSAVDVRRAVAKTVENAGIKAILEKSYWSVSEQDYDTLATLGAVGIQNLALELTLRAEMQQAYEQRSKTLPKVAKFLRRDVKLLQEPEAAPEPDEEEEEGDPSDERYCEVCEDAIAPHALGSPYTEEQRMFTTIFHLESGVLVVARNEYHFTFCPECAPAVQICRVCGCIDQDACEDSEGDSCWWVETDLCSACVGKEKVDAESSNAAPETPERPTLVPLQVGDMVHVTSKSLPPRAARVEAVEAGRVPREFEMVLVRYKDGGRTELVHVVDVERVNQFRAGDRVWVKNRYDDGRRAAVVQTHSMESVYLTYEESGMSEYRNQASVTLRGDEDVEETRRLCASCGVAEPTTGRYCADCDPANPPVVLTVADTEAALV